MKEVHYPKQKTFNPETLVCVIPICSDVPTPRPHEQRPKSFSCDDLIQQISLLISKGVKYFWFYFAEFDDVTKNEEKYQELKLQKITDIDKSYQPLWEYLEKEKVNHEKIVYSKFRESNHYQSAKQFLESLIEDREQKTSAIIERDAKNYIRRQQKRNNNSVSYDAVNVLTKTIEHVKKEVPEYLAWVITNWKTMKTNYLSENDPGWVILLYPGSLFETMDHALQIAREKGLSTKNTKRIKDASEFKLKVSGRKDEKEIIKDDSKKDNAKLTNDSLDTLFISLTSLLFTIKSELAKGNSTNIDPCVDAALLIIMAYKKNVLIHTKSKSDLLKFFANLIAEENSNPSTLPSHLLKFNSGQ